MSLQDWILSGLGGATAELLAARAVVAERLGDPSRAADLAARALAAGPLSDDVRGIAERLATASTPP